MVVTGAGTGTDRGKVIGVLQPHSAASSKTLAQMEWQLGNRLRKGFANIGGLGGLGVVGGV